MSVCSQQLNSQPIDIGLKLSKALPRTQMCMCTHSLTAVREHSTHTHTHIAPPSRAAVLNIWVPGTGFMEDNFSPDQEGWRMIWG